MADRLTAVVQQFLDKFDFDESVCMRFDFRTVFDQRGLQPADVDYLQGTQRLVHRLSVSCLSSPFKGVSTRNCIGCPFPAPVQEPLRRFCDRTCICRIGPASVHEQNEGVACCCPADVVPRFAFGNATLLYRVSRIVFDRAIGYCE